LRTEGQLEGVSVWVLRMPQPVRKNSNVKM
jgi:hypothetical protein